MWPQFSLCYDYGRCCHGSLGLLNHVWSIQRWRKEQSDVYHSNLILWYELNVLFLLSKVRIIILGWFFVLLFIKVQQEISVSSFKHKVRSPAPRWTKYIITMICDSNFKWKIGWLCCISSKFFNIDLVKKYMIINF